MGKRPIFYFRIAVKGTLKAANGHFIFVIVGKDSLSLGHRH